MSYLGEFLALRCAQDVLGTVGDIGNKPAKEVSEAMAVIKVARKLILREPGRYNIVELCAGNSLPAVLGVYLLPITRSVAIDNRRRVRPWYKADRFEHVRADIYEDISRYIDANTIILSVHPCTQLANRVIDIYTKTPAAALVMMPCCCGGKAKPSSMPSVFWGRMTPYERWCYVLYNKLQMAEKGGSVSLKFDARCLSPARGILAGIRTRKVWTPPEE